MNKREVIKIRKQIQELNDEQRKNHIKFESSYMENHIDKYEFPNVTAIMDVILKKYQAGKMTETEFALAIHAVIDYRVNNNLILQLYDILDGEGFFK